MLNRRTHRRHIALLGIFAMLAQLLLPIAHAASMAQRSGNPLSLVFCGNGTGHSAALFAQLPPEVRSALEQKSERQMPPACTLCAAMHGAHLAGAPATPRLPAAEATPAIRAEATPLRAASGYRFTPPARAPPPISV
ncbi:hypothetical protein E4T66_05255 [Sinimarinibacterium sp. CAU 1509]|uniref:DUF2946 family protein n=1 Tax=Sinimarinibacterium sp. CAU 1509 TaxID=2562283 RepID=UPI0010ACD1D4|nr:DUF2946 family protein [Sinimarinibacterium sp. CAU 1509]TJY63120.1 hypothetical protein E4T66_05255 [Sinimarinibacterium sp. CAU 1509]